MDYGTYRERRGRRQGQWEAVCFSAILYTALLAAVLSGGETVRSGVHFVSFLLVWAVGLFTGWTGRRSRKSVGEFLERRRQRNEDREPSATKALYRIAQGLDYTQTTPEKAARATLEAMGEDVPNNEPAEGWWVKKDAKALERFLADVERRQASLPDHGKI